MEEAIHPTTQFYGTIWLLFCAYIGGSLPYATRLSIGGLEQVGTNLLETARVQGANIFQMMLRIVGPLLRANLVSIWLLVFTGTMFELAASELLDPPGQPTMPVRIIGLFNDFKLGPGYIAFGMRLRRTPTPQIKQRVDELLELVNLPGLGSRYPYQLSGGQQQRVAVARALATKPRLVLLDEPLSSLDAGLRESMRTEIVQLFQRLKITSINVTHDQDEAMSMSDRILVLREGKVQQIGTPTDLYRHPVNPFVAAFMGHANMLAGKIAENTDGQEALSLHLDEAGENASVVTGQLHENVRQHLNGRARLLVRPENVHVYQESRQFAHQNVFEGQVSHTSFVGGQWRALITLDKGQCAQVLAYPPFQPLVNQRVWLELPPEHCQIVPD